MVPPWKMSPHKPKHYRFTHKTHLSGFQSWALEASAFEFITTVARLQTFRRLDHSTFAIIVNGFCCSCELANHRAASCRHNEVWRGAASYYCHRAELLARWRLRIRRHPSTPGNGRRPPSPAGRLVASNQARLGWQLLGIGQGGRGQC